MKSRLLPLLIAACALTLPAHAQQAEPVTIEPAKEVMLDAAPAMPAVSYDQVWVYPGTSDPAQFVSLDVPIQGNFPTGLPVPFQCEIQSRYPYQQAYVTFTIHPVGSNDVIVQDAQTLPLFPGQNICTFNLDATGIAPGKYVLEIAVDYVSEQDIARYVTTLKRVTAAQMATDYDAVTTLLQQLQAAILTNENQAPLSPYFGMRLNIAKNFLDVGKAEFARQDWTRADDTLSYLLEATKSLHAELVLKAHVPELTGDYSRPDLSTLTVQNGGFYAQGQPVFLFGRAFENPTPQDIAEIDLYGLNLAEFAIAPENSFRGEQDRKPLESVFGPLFDRASKRNVAVNVRLAPDRLGNWAFARWPEIRDKGFVDLSHDGAKSVYQQHVEAVMPWLGAQPMLMAVSIAEQPRFAFYDDVTLGHFIDSVREMYPDRQDLNRAWRAHLADYDEITLKGEFAHSYQNRRAFQYDWQTFYRNMAVNHMGWAADVVRREAPNVLLMATLSDGAFEPGETRDGVDREAVARMMDINGCVAKTDPNDSIYALSYPRQSAFNTLMRSLQPNKPVFLVEDHIELSPDADPEYAYDYVRSAMWEAVISGANAAALPDDSTVLQRPDTLEAFARTSLDINRLAEIVMAFQQAPTEIAILFSAASKILDDGVPHLKSAWYAYEGCSFAGFNVRYVTEDQIREGALDRIEVLVIPETPAISDDTFASLMKYVEEEEGAVARVGTPIPYNEHGQSRTNVLRMTGNTKLVRGMNLPTEYLHAMDAAIELGTLPRIPRPINAHGFPLEGVRTRYVEFNGTPYLYLVNVSQAPVNCHLAGGLQQGRDLIDGHDVTFPRVVKPLKPMLIALNKAVYQKSVTAESGITPAR